MRREEGAGSSFCENLQKWHKDKVTEIVKFQVAVLCNNYSVFLYAGSVNKRKE